MEILLWLVPSALVTLAAMAWVGWVGREGHGEVDREEAVRALGRALAKDHRTRLRPPPVRPRDRSTGVAVRTRTPSAPSAPARPPVPAPAPGPLPDPAPDPAHDPADVPERRPSRRAS